MYIVQFSDPARFGKMWKKHQYSLLTDERLNRSQHPNPHHQVPYCEKSMVLIFYPNTRSLFNKKKRCVLLLLHMILLYVALQQTTAHNRRKGLAIVSAFIEIRAKMWK